jgi:hypothetical protein
MDNHYEPAAEYHNFDEVELGFIVNLRTLSETLETLSIDGRRWWLATDPTVALENRYVMLAFGYPGCDDPLNTTYYRLPVLSESLPPTGTDRIAILFEASHFFADVHPGGRGGEDSRDFLSAFVPVKLALLRRLEVGQ